jgi:hypothetical protein
LAVAQATPEAAGEITEHTEFTCDWSRSIPRAAAGPAFPDAFVDDGVIHASAP